MQRIFKLLQEDERLLARAKQEIDNYYCLVNGELIPFREMNCMECDMGISDCHASLIEWLGEEVE